MSSIRQVCLYLTRHCNLKCRYCQIVDNNKFDEIGTSATLEALRIIKKKIDPEFLILFGGEPFLRPDLQMIIDYTNKLDFNYTVITNGTIDRDIQNIKGITCSVDWIDPPIEKALADDVKKSIAGLETLFAFKKQGVPDVTGNMIIHKENYTRVETVVTTLSKFGIWTVLGVVHSGKGFTFRSDCEDLRLSRKEAKAVQSVLLKMCSDKKYLLHNVDAYLANIAVWGHYLDWRCWKQMSESEYLIIDSDGSLLACNDRFGRYTPQMSIFDFDELQYQENWLNDVQGCSGCFYNHIWQLLGSHKGEGLVHP